MLRHVARFRWFEMTGFDSFIGSQSQAVTWHGQGPPKFVKVRVIVAVVESMTSKYTAPSTTIESHI